MIGKNIKTEKDLARFIDKHLARPGILPAPQAPIALIKAEGAVTDDDFPQPPLDRTMAVQYEEGEPVLVVRIGGEWTVVG